MPHATDEALMASTGNDIMMEELEIPDAELAEEDETPKKTGYSYSKEHKLKRYYACLRDFMAHFHHLTEAYPLDHEFTDDELNAIEPQDIVNWMNVKMFGVLEPDFSGGKASVSGSHHTLAFYRKGIGYFMPSGMTDWDTNAKTGNPTRSKEIRDLIAKVKALNDDGIATPKNTGKRNSEDGGGKPKSKPRKKAKTTPNRASEPLPFTVSEEVNGLLRHMHAQQNKFVRALDDMSAKVEKMKRDVETSYGVMIGQVSNIGARIATATANQQAHHADAPVAPLLPRSRNLFTAWHVQNGKLTPLEADWIFPTRLSVLEAINMWMLGEPSSHTPPLQYLTVGHMKHVKGAADTFNKVRRFMKICRYLGLKAGYWCENWDGDRIAILWTKIWPGIEALIGPSSNDAKDGDIGCRTLMNSLAKQQGIAREMADNPQILKDELVASFVVKSTEEAARGVTPVQAGEEGGDAEDGSGVSTSTRSRSMELLWGVHNGKLNPLPEDWEFPITSSIVDALHLWLLGDPERKIPPFKYIHSSYVGHLKSGTGYLSKLRCVMKVINHFGVKFGCWYEEGWDDENIKTLWYTVWDGIEDRIKFKRTNGRTGTVTWQSVYNRMHESGIIKEVSADGKVKDEDADEEKEADDQEIEAVVPEQELEAVMPEQELEAVAPLELTEAV